MRSLVYVYFALPCAHGLCVNVFVQKFRILGGARAFHEPCVTRLPGRGVSWSWFLTARVERLALGVSKMMVDRFGSIADELVLQCAVTTKR